MFNLFGSGIYKELQRAQFNLSPRRDQNAVLQHLYDKGYSVPDIAKALDLKAPAIYNRINAHRGRGPQTDP